MSVYQTVRTSLQKRAAYRRTKREIQSMSLDIALDLGIFREDAAKIASKAVYG